MIQGKKIIKIMKILSSESYFHYFSRFFDFEAKKTTNYNW